MAKYNNGYMYKIMFSSSTKNLEIVWYTELNGIGVIPEGSDLSSENTQYPVYLNGKVGILSDMHGNIIGSNLVDGTWINIGEELQYIEYQK